MEAVGVTLVALVPKRATKVTPATRHLLIRWSLAAETGFEARRRPCGPPSEGIYKACGKCYTLYGWNRSETKQLVHGNRHEHPTSHRCHYFFSGFRRCLAGCGRKKVVDRLPLHGTVTLANGEKPSGFHQLPARKR